MAFRDPLAVYDAANNMEAHLVCDLLVEAGVEAMVIEDVSQAGVWMAGMVPQIHKPQVWIERDSADRAAVVVAEYEQKMAARRSSAGEGIVVTCDECGQRSVFPAAMRGLVEVCRHCGEYVDVEPTVERSEVHEKKGSYGAPANRTPQESDNPYRPPETVEGSEKAPTLLKSLSWLLPHGRISRQTWWVGQIVLFIPIVGFFNGLGLIIPGWLGDVIGWLILWSGFVLAVKRLHDMDTSGWWLLLISTGVGIVALMFMLGFLAGTEGPNQFGADPHEDF